MKLYILKKFIVSFFYHNIALQSCKNSVVSGVAQVASEGMDDTRMDLSQLEDSGTGRSVPSTPLQVSPQGIVKSVKYLFFIICHLVIPKI